MSDPTIEEESLISQDDIDKLLDSSSIEEAELKLDAAQDTPDVQMDEIGELSQDDIDNLLNGTALDGDDDLVVSDTGMDEMGELSQDDIDSLLGGDDADEAGELSQDDIDSLLNGPSDPIEMDDALGNDLSGDADDELELISQDDIDKLMNPSDDVLDGDDLDDDDLVSLDDIQGLLEADVPEAELKTDVPPAPDRPEPAVSLDDPEPDAPLVRESAPQDSAPENSQAQDQDQAQDPGDQPIDAADAYSGEDCLITQDTMDELIRNAPAPDAEPVMETGPAEASRPAMDPETLEDFVDLSGQDDSDAANDVVDLGADEDGMDELDALLSEDDDSLDLGMDLDGEGDVTQDDIDALLQESDGGDDFLDDDDDILISQDDIDTLLMAADQEDEDVLGDIMGADDSMDDLEDQDILDAGGMDDFGSADDADQVVLEGGEAFAGKAEDVQASPKGEKIKKLLKSKLVLAAASMLLVLGISIPAAYFLFFSSTPEPLPQTAAVPMDDQSQDMETATITIDEVPVMIQRQAGTLVLTDFVILASDLTADMTYVYADIAIDYSDQRAYHEISNNLSFYRDLIYEAILKSLVSEKRDEVTQSDLIWKVETSLKKVLPPDFIDKVSFKTFRTS